MIGMHYGTLCWRMKYVRSMSVVEELSRAFVISRRAWQGFHISLLLSNFTKGDFLQDVFSSLLDAGVKILSEIVFRSKFTDDITLLKETQCTPNHLAIEVSTYHMCFSPANVWGSSSRLVKARLHSPFCWTFKGIQWLKLFRDSVYNW